VSAGRAGQAGEPATIAVKAELIGQSARPVVRQLREAGLVPRVEWSNVGQIPAGTVIGVRPEGNVAPGTIITVTVAALPPNLLAAVLMPAGPLAGRQSVTNRDRSDYLSL